MDFRAILHLHSIFTDAQTGLRGLIPRGGSFPTPVVPNADREVFWADSAIGHVRE